MSRTVKFDRAGGSGVLKFVEEEVRSPGPSEVRVTVKAIGVNRAEAMWRVDDYIGPVGGRSFAKLISTLSLGGIAFIYGAFDRIADVRRYLEKNGQFGKIVVTV